LLLNIEEALFIPLKMIILFLYSLTYPQVFIELQPELLFKIVILILSWGNLGVEYFRVKRELNKVLN